VVALRDSKKEKLDTRVLGRAAAREEERRGGADREWVPWIKSAFLCGREYWKSKTR